MKKTCRNCDNLGMPKLPLKCTEFLKDGGGDLNYKCKKYYNKNRSKIIKNIFKIIFDLFFFLIFTGGLLAAFYFLKSYIGNRDIADLFYSLFSLILTIGISIEREIDKLSKKLGGKN
jgi:hypothetical protein